MSRTNPMAYRIGPFAPPGDLRSTAITSCAKCGNEGKIIIAGMGNNPEKIEKLYIRLGWDYQRFSPGQCICAKCVKQREIRATEEVTRPRPVEAPGLRTAQVVQALNPQKEPTMRSSSRGDVGIKSLTPEQKSKLRSELDSTFDDSVGRYLEGNSDHKISEKLDIARTIVQEFRENFYGELQDDPEISAFRQQLDDAKRVLSNMQGTVAKMELKLDEISRKVGL